MGCVPVIAAKDVIRKVLETRACTYESNLSAGLALCGNDHDVQKQLKRGCNGSEALQRITLGHEQFECMSLHFCIHQVCTEGAMMAMAHGKA